jgi:hypothetical protein
MTDPKAVPQKPLPPFNHSDYKTSRVEDQSAADLQNLYYFVWKRQPGLIEQFNYARHGKDGRTKR